MLRYYAYTIKYKAIVFPPPEGNEDKKYNIVAITFAI